MKPVEPRARAVFLDRDGTIMEDANYVGHVERVVVIPGAVGALRRLQQAGFRLFIVTNQSGVGRGYFSREAVEEIHAHLDRIFGAAGVRFDRYYVCPHHPDEGCDCRKPKPRFLLEAAGEYGLDLAGSFMVGDRLTDIQTGANAGAKTVLVLTGIGEQTQGEDAVKPDHVARDIAAAADWILSTTRRAIGG
jgi:histidinol-phosphate phosphatase family protein